MSLFKVTKNTYEQVSSSPLDTQSSNNKEENIWNDKPKVLTDYLTGNYLNLKIQNGNNKIQVKQSSRREINVFYARIKYIRKKYNIKKSRKNHIDSLVKKAKSKFIKAIFESLKYCLHSCNLYRLPQKFIINTRIEYNKKVLNQTVEEIYSEYNLLPNFETLVKKNMVYKDRKDFLFSLMKSKLKDIYKYYISSDLYTLDKKKIEKKSGEAVVKLYDYVATNICEYFLLNKGNDKRLNRWRNTTNLKRIIKKKRFETHKSLSQQNNNIDNNREQKKNIAIKFNIFKSDDSNDCKNEEKQ